MVTQEDLLDLKVGLNKGQSEGFDKLVDFIGNDYGNKMFVLRGYAGTGKTFLSSRIVNYINSNSGRRSIGISSPTNKALKVLLENINVSINGILYKTIYQFLGLTEKVDRYGNRTFERDKKTKFIDIEDLGYLIVDEVSMLNDDIFAKILPYANNIKIIFMGDPAQIPPIGKKSCVPFDPTKQDMFITHSLTEIMRQEDDNPIIDLSYLTRENLNHSLSYAKDTRLNSKGDGIIFMNGSNGNDRQKLKPLLNQYFNSEEFRKDPNFAKVIAWRGETVTYLNNTIRNMIFPYDDFEFDLEEHGKILPGEKLIANTPIFSDINNILFNTSSEFDVEGVKEGSIWIKGVHGMKQMKTYNCMVMGGRWNKNAKSKIQILHEDSEQEYKLIIDGLRQRAIESEGRNYSWPAYYNAQKLFADIAYNYAITAHKAQGSGYNNVFFIESDVDLNPNIVERNQIKYTSYTRSKNKLFIFK